MFFFSETKPLLQLLKPGVVPHLFPWTKTRTPNQVSREERAVKRRKLHHKEPDLSDWIGSEVIIGEEVVVEEVPEEEAVASAQCISVQTKETGGLKFHSTDHMFDNRRFLFYTGLDDYDLFNLLFEHFGETVNELNYFYGTKPGMKPQEQFYMTLIKLRLAKSNYELSGLFGISEKECTNIFITWVNFMYHEFLEMPIWPSRELVSFYSPADFKRKFPSTRVIIDGTEIPLQRPKQPTLQQATYSTYKNRNTVKVLIGISPSGLVTYISDVYRSSTSDRQICERSNLTTLCEPGDSIMSDKGFNVQDLFIPSHVTINIPEFFKKKNRMSAKSVANDRKIASKRVHVERIIGLAKTFKILKKPLNNTESDLADAIITVVFHLCNFKPAIVSKDA